MYAFETAAVFISASVFGFGGVFGFEVGFDGVFTFGGVLGLDGEEITVKMLASLVVGFAGNPRWTAREGCGVRSKEYLRCVRLLQGLRGVNSPFRRRNIRWIIA